MGASSVTYCRGPRNRDEPYGQFDKTHRCREIRRPMPGRLMEMLRCNNTMAKWWTNLPTSQRWLTVSPDARCPQFRHVQARVEIRAARRSQPACARHRKPSLPTCHKHRTGCTVFAVQAIKPSMMTPASGALQVVAACSVNLCVCRPTVLVDHSAYPCLFLGIDPDICLLQPSAIRSSHRSLPPK
jgi:hypothetical protein